MSIRDSIRSATVGSKAEFKKEIVEFNGRKVEIRQPSVKVRRELFKRCMDDQGRVDSMDFLVWAVIYNTYVPGTDERVYDEEDYDAFISKPAGGFMDKFGEVASKLMNVEESTEKK